MEYDVSVTRVRCYDQVFRVEADSSEEAEEKGLQEACDDDAGTWCSMWCDTEVDGVHPVEQSK